MSPSVLRQRRRAAPRAAAGGGTGPAADLVRLTLAYRPPLAWDALLQRLAADSVPGIEVVERGRYTRTVSLDGCRGFVTVERAVWSESSRRLRGASADRRAGTGPGGELAVHLSASLLPVLMPLLARLRQLFDLDAEPSVIDGHLSDGGLAAVVARRPGLRMPGAFDGFEAVLRELLRGTAAGWIAEALGETIETELPGLVRLAPTAECVAGAGAPFLARLGVPPRSAEAIVAVARAVTEARCTWSRGPTSRRRCARWWRYPASGSGPRRPSSCARCSGPTRFRRAMPRSSAPAA